MYKHFMYRRSRIPRKFQVKILRAFSRCKDRGVWISFDTKRVHFWDTPVQSSKISSRTEQCKYIHSNILISSAPCLRFQNIFSLLSLIKAAALTADKHSQKYVTFIIRHCICVSSRRNKNVPLSMRDTLWSLERQSFIRDLLSPNRPKVYFKIENERYTFMDCKKINYIYKSGSIESWGYIYGGLYKKRKKKLKNPLRDSIDPLFLFLS